MPEGWVPTRRFPVVQHDKLRPIDDLTECGTNGACSTLDKLDLRALDETVFTAMLIMRCLESRCFALRLDDGRVLRGRVHPYWLQHPDGAHVLVKTVDLKSAYKNQTGIHGGPRHCSGTATGNRLTFFSRVKAVFVLSASHSRKPLCRP